MVQVKISTIIAWKAYSDGMYVVALWQMTTEDILVDLRFGDKLVLCDFNE